MDNKKNERISDILFIHLYIFLKGPPTHGTGLYLKLLD